MWQGSGVVLHRPTKPVFRDRSCRTTFIGRTRESSTNEGRLALCSRQCSARGYVSPIRVKLRVSPPSTLARRMGSAKTGLVGRHDPPAVREPRPIKGLALTGRSAHLATGLSASDEGGEQTEKGNPPG